MPPVPIRKPEPEPEPEPEGLDKDSLKIIDWRASELERAGAPPLIANTLATNRNVDLHKACEVVRGLFEKGLDPHLAVDILT